MNVTIDQSQYFKGDTAASKENSIFYNSNNPNDDPDNHKEHPDPFLFTNSKVMTGQGKAVVCSVGDYTMLARSRK